MNNDERYLAEQASAQRPRVEKRRPFWRRPFLMSMLVLMALFSICAHFSTQTCEDRARQANAALRYGWEDLFHDAITKGCR